MNRVSDEQLKQLIEAALFVADAPMTARGLKDSVLAGFAVSIGRINEMLDELELDYRPRGVQLVKVGGGYRFQTLESLSPFLGNLWEERAPRYSRALLETLALIAYRQPVTRGQIEKVRGVSVSANIMRTLQDRGWIKVVGHKEVPGRPALYATTDAFLHYFCLDSLSSLPPLEEEGALDALLSAGQVEAEPQVH
ncbi:SMC-Scp complex subunit ScpB [Ferrimonas balearica]|uniref:SMC-Scp complex subunit ScpB n=1 Tax=Ferrimonas balearica TaxID=44012 RepID=UPI001C994D7D|nr:SMC-Scp complex subunit ScpB [Ferrimonas balearica]MBY5922207.1 SMC-Scp complex subunit ScpB [Ferrimonas balearica]MBY5994453.1 SMC-Scp complex subunit ScpB [Ferrimonas balearica]